MQRLLPSTRNWAVSAIVLSGIYILLALATMAGMRLLPNHESAEPVSMGLAVIGIGVAILSIVGAAGVLRGSESGRDMLSLTAASAALVTVLNAVYYGFAHRLPMIGSLLDNPPSDASLPSAAIGQSSVPMLSIPHHDAGLAIISLVAAAQLVYCISLYRHMATA